MSKILTDELIPELKDKVESDSSNLKVYAVAPTEDGVFNIVDSSLPSTPVEGMQFILRPTANMPSGTVPKISVNSSTPLGVNRQHINANNPARVEMGSMNSGNHYWIVWANNYWRCLNSPTTVSAADADVTSIMNSAGDNGQLFGLGGSFINISNTDLNSLQAKTGFYVGENLTNGPTAQIGEWYYIEQYAGLGGYTLQRATYLFDASRLYQRVKENGTWESWQRIVTVPSPSSTGNSGSITLGSTTIKWGEKNIGTMNNGSYDNTQITFPGGAFSAIPTVIVSSNHTRMAVSASSITPSYFYSQALSSMDNINGIVRWIAIG